MDWGRPRAGEHGEQVVTHIVVRSMVPENGKRGKVLFRYRHDVTFCYSARLSPLVRSSHKRHNAHAYIHQSENTLLPTV